MHQLRKLTQRRRKSSDPNPPPVVKEAPVTPTGESADASETSQPAATDLARYQIQALSPAHRPLLVFVNGRSGGHQGAELCKRLRCMLNPLQVVELPLAQPQPALRLFLSVMRLRILVAGGDGTVAWVLSALDEVRQEMPNVPAPPVAVLPLGTGNDLARVLGWAAKAGWGLEPANVDLTRVMRDVERSTVALLDRWQVTFSPHDQQPNASGQRILNNYYGVGVDAKVAFMMHSLRETYPTAFKSQVGNKLWYTGMGASESLVHSCSSLFKHLQIECDGEVLELPEHVEGILVLNITSFMEWTAAALQVRKRAPFLIQRRVTAERITNEAARLKLRFDSAERPKVSSAA
ncbi:hypothetical protein CYMTET_29325 [Cymbomonas tetramitiformis]|uniref:Diacylglycerol kinase n=1 Tax=Cymbomonas tetramitiformis TaxID=36881 RepID=A0AAE0KV93_9CHLO|nr:hypothetical protein CYMTET_29325 [Cymbomonas tetramitiformis]